MALPVGTLTFVFTDIEGSTRLWERYPEAMQIAHARHTEIIIRNIEAHGGIFVRTRGEGDSTFSVFHSAGQALAACFAFQRAFAAEAWPPNAPIRVRAALHLGDAEPFLGDYNSSAVNRCARIRSIAHGGQTLLSQIIADLVQEQLPPGVWLKNLGIHRLKDLQQSEQIWQVCHAELPDDFPPLASLSFLPNNLPVQITSFVGREQQLAEAKTVLGSTRLLTITGAGGCGKTRLCLQIAADSLEQYPDGVWLVELAAITDPQRVYQAVARALHIQEEVDCSVLDSLISALRAKSLLLVLDNCEHLRKVCAELVSRLLRETAGIRLVATSRQALGITGEVVWPVPSLTVPGQSEMELPPDKLVSRLGDYDAVRLFTERAHAAQPTFVLSDTNARAAAQICRHLDGIPLALELAAARVKSLSVNQIVDRLHNRFALLRNNDQTVLPRQQTLQALMDWSYDLLTPQERTFLQRLAVFVGGWTLEAAEQVCADAQIAEEEILDLLAALVDQSLVIVEADTAGTRYRMQETVRAYALAKTQAGEDLNGLQARHLDYFYQAAAQQQNLSAEYNNLRAALEFSLTLPEVAAETRRTGLRLFRQLLWFWVSNGYYKEGKHWAEMALRHQECGDLVVQAETLFAAGVLLNHYGESQSGCASLEESISLFRECHEVDGLGEALTQLGHARRNQGDLVQARACLTESVEVLQTAKNRGTLGWAYSILGGIAGAEGDLNEAAQWEQKALQRFRMIDMRDGIVSALSGLGEIAFANGDYATARLYLDESVEIARENGFLNLLPWLLASVGAKQIEMGKRESARDMLRESVELAREPGRQSHLAEALMGLGRLAFIEGQGERAARLYGAAMAHSTRRLAPHEEVRYTQDQQELRVALGEMQYTTLLEIGQTLTVERALLFALSEEP